MTAAPPGYDGIVPYGFGVVELDGIGLQLVTRLTVADVDAVSFGQAMELVVDRLAGGLEVWAFAPEAPGPESTGPAGGAGR